MALHFRRNARQQRFGEVSVELQEALFGVCRSSMTKIQVIEP